MSGRETSGWGDCVWCGEILKPEDPYPYSDRCEFCLSWNELSHIAIKREFYAKDKVKKAKEDKNQKALEYWSKVEKTYFDIHKALIPSLNLKKGLWGEGY